MLFPPFLQLSRQESSVCQAGDKEEEDCPSSLRPIYYRGGGEDPFPLSLGPLSPLQPYIRLFIMRRRRRTRRGDFFKSSLTGRRWEGETTEGERSHIQARQVRGERFMPMCSRSCQQVRERERERRYTFTNLELGVTLKNYCEPFIRVCFDIVLF